MKPKRVRVSPGLARHWALGLLLIAALAASGCLATRPERPGPDGPGRQGRHRDNTPAVYPEDLDAYMVLLTKRLHLSPDQAEKVRPAAQAKLTQRRELLDRLSGLDEDQRRQELLVRQAKLDRAMAKELEPILSPVQMDALEKLDDEMLTSRAGGPPGGGRGMGGRPRY